MLVCPECWDPDQPQNQLGRYNVDDPQALRNPRPDQGLTESRYGDSIRYDFDEGVEGFTLTIDAGSPAYPAPVPYGSVSYNSDSKTIISTPYDNELGRGVNGIATSLVSVDTSTYDFVRVRVKVNTNPAPSPNESYDATMYWRTTQGAYGNNAQSVTNADWLQMGDPYQLLTWDLSSNANWSGTVTGLYWVFFTGLTKSGVYEIDYVTFDSS